MCQDISRKILSLLQSKWAVLLSQKKLYPRVFARDVGYIQICISMLLCLLFCVREYLKQDLNFQCEEI